MASGEPRLAAHGGPNHAELDALELRYEDVLDFSVSTNPYGPAPEMRQAVLNAAIDQYPEPTAARAREAIAEWLDVSARGVLLGNGAADLLWSVARALLTPQDVALIVEPTFSELRQACVALGAQVVEWRARAEDSFALDLEAISALTRQCGAKLAYLCTPNTPTGANVRAELVSRLAQRHGDTTWIVDQSFLSLSEDHGDRDTAMPGNVILLRSLTKDHTLPGLRVGYLVTTPRWAALIDRQRAAWSSSAMAQAAAIAATALDAFVADSRDRLLDDRRQLAADLQAFGLTVVPSRASYVLA
jgi:histidinol-phosphate/aromatic aminotransferase/cobyric acid decarboxylase-like protein